MIYHLFFFIESCYKRWCNNLSENHNNNISIKENWKSWHTIWMLKSGQGIPVVSQTGRELAIKTQRGSTLSVIAAVSHALGMHRRTWRWLKLHCGLRQIIGFAAFPFFHPNLHEAGEVMRHTSAIPARVSLRRLKNNKCGGRFVRRWTERQY